MDPKEFNKLGVYSKKAKRHQLLLQQQEIQQQNQQRQDEIEHNGSSTIPTEDTGVDSNQRVSGRSKKKKKAIKKHTEVDINKNFFFSHYPIDVSIYPSIFLFIHSFIHSFIIVTIQQHSQP